MTSSINPNGSALSRPLSPPGKANGISEPSKVTSSTGDFLESSLTPDAFAASTILGVGWIRSAIEIISSGDAFANSDLALTKVEFRVSDTATASSSSETPLIPKVFLAYQSSIVIPALLAAPRAI